MMGMRDCGATSAGVAAGRVQAAYVRFSDGQLDVRKCCLAAKDGYMSQNLNAKIEDLMRRFTRVRCSVFMVPLAAELHAPVYLGSCGISGASMVSHRDGCVMCRQEFCRYRQLFIVKRFVMLILKILQDRRCA